MFTSTDYTNSDRGRKVFLGKYRGTVVDNQCPKGLACLLVKVPGILEGTKEEPWAMPCFPYAGRDVGFFFIPPIGAGVWVEFEGGDPSFPIWTGCFWSDADRKASEAKSKNGQPIPIKDPNIQIIKTPEYTLTIEGSKLELKNKQGASISIDGDRLEIVNGLNKSKLEMKGRTVTINNDGLEVT